MLFSLFLFSKSFGQEQQLGFALPEGASKVRMDFEQYNNLIVIPVTINEDVKLNFILDTGVQYPILTEKFFGDLLNFEYPRKILIQGPGIEDSITALVASDVRLTLPGGVTSGINQSFLVLENDYLQLRENLGADVYGIIGFDIFSRFIVEVNYEENYLVLYEPKKFKGKKKYKKVPITLDGTKPYIPVTVSKENQGTITLPLMIDTGASHSLLINNPEENSFLPEKNVATVIGRGLGGEIYGHLGRVSTIQVDKFELENPIISFPLKGDYGSLAKKGAHNGTVGGEFLSRFNVVIDYHHNSFYLKKNKHFSREFEHDMSGMTIAANGEEFDSYRVLSVRYGSPAHEAGVRVGDIIVSINGFTFDTIKLEGAMAILRRQEGKKITLRILEGEEYVKKAFKLERFI